MKRKPLRDTIAENNKAMDMYATLSGKPTPDSYTELTAHLTKPKRERAAPKPSTIPNEHQEQVAFVKWFRMQHPKVRIFAVPNAAMRSYELAAYLTAEGLSKGCPDLWIPEWQMTIEMKRIKGSVTSPEQIAWRDYLLDIGWAAWICNGFDEAKKVCEERVR